jgi:hypothetical protein
MAESEDSEEEEAKAKKAAEEERRKRLGKPPHHTPHTTTTPENAPSPQGPEAPTGSSMILSATVCWAQKAGYSLPQSVQR